MTDEYSMGEEKYSDGLLAKYEGWIAQEKQNGIRVFLQLENGVPNTIRNRRGVPMLYLFPEIQKLRFGDYSGLLDGELCVFENGKSKFYGGINQRDKKFKSANVSKYPVCFVAFDLVSFADLDISDKPYAYRYEQLISNFANFSSENFKVAESIADAQAFWDSKVVKENREGLILKNPTALYKSGCVKVKNYKVLQMKINKVEGNPRGTKVWANHGEVVGEIQLGGIFNIEVGMEIPVEFLDITADGKLIQPHKIVGWKPL